METSFEYGRVLLKLSGESLKGSSNDSPYCGDTIKLLVEELGALIDSGLELGIVVGGGNIWRGAKSSDRSLHRASADYMGMIATVMNSIYLRDAFNSCGFSAVVQSAIPMDSIVSPFNGPEASRALDEGKLVIFAGGTGHPYFTTDTCAALRAVEIGASALLKATKVDGVYSSDPHKNPSAKRFEKLSYDEALAGRYEVMDMTAFSICRDNKVPIVVFNFSKHGGMEKILSGDMSIGTLVS